MAALDREHSMLFFNPTDWRQCDIGETSR